MWRDVVRNEFEQVQGPAPCLRNDVHYEIVVINGNMNPASLSDEMLMQVRVVLGMVDPSRVDWDCEGVAAALDEEIGRRGLSLE